MHTSSASLESNVVPLARKFRDELRPRHGLLRTREFTMKDLYTFDISTEAALETYGKVQSAYAGVFKSLKLPVMVAKASSGDMGGDLSHEYHLPTSIGEDTVVTCDSCDYTVNSEIAETRTDITKKPDIDSQTGAVDASILPVKVWRGVSRDRSSLINAWYPGQLRDGSDTSEIMDGDVSIPAIKSVVPDLDASIDDGLSLWQAAMASVFSGKQTTARRPRIINVVDFRLAKSIDEALRNDNVHAFSQTGITKGEVEFATVMEDRSGRLLNLLTVRSGDGCPSCEKGILKIQKALEVGHTFHLGTRYSEPLGAMVTLPTKSVPSGSKERFSSTDKTALMQMGCHGIGVSRLIGAVVEHLADDKGLQWPRAIAPFEVVVVAATDLDKEAAKVYDEITASLGDMADIEAVLDDRSLSFAWKLKDADLVGYPVLVVLGKVWKETGSCEVQCRRLGFKETVPLANIRQRISELLGQL